MSHDGELLDMLVVGGGPAGTAAAFRAQELGLSALVIDYDDLMKRIRDYSKDKLILPTFGGGDRICFPKGDRLVDCLCFDPIDKDDLCLRWKALYDDHGVRTEIGLELTSLERLNAGSYLATTWDHNRHRERTLGARHVVLALGRGVPRRFDIPGNTEGIAYQLCDPALYVGEPACVIGGGTSAAEAVIAISSAKMAAGDPTSVYWSYRGDKMPRVSKALADDFFSAYVGNGNIRYYRKSEPSAVFVGDDRREYLALRVDRRRLEGRPNELSMLEFPKQHCLACIGEEIPETLLTKLGIERVVGGAKKKKRTVVNRFLESHQPRIYLVGDLLSQVYLETADFDAEPAGFREVPHRGNIKSALRDGVRVAQVIQQRLAGVEPVDVTVLDTEEGPGSDRDRAPAQARDQAQAMTALAQPVTSEGPPPPGQPPERSELEAEAFLIRVLPTGVEEEEHPLRRDGVTTLGSGDCDISMPSDSMLAPRHASISHHEDGYFLRDDGGPTGVFLTLPAAAKEELAAGDLVRAGRQFLLFAGGDDPPAVIHYDASGAEAGRYPLTPGKTHVAGRGAPDIVLDPDDGTLSRRHLSLCLEGGRLFVKDLKSVNGTHLRVRTARRLDDGCRIRLGMQTFTFRLRDESEGAGDRSAPTPEREAASASPPTDRPTDSKGAVVTVKGGGTISVAAGQTLCQAAEASGLEITAECHSGICGSDPVRILSGAENLVADADDQERETLEEICELEPGPCRLACMLRFKGPVEVEFVNG